VGGERAAGVSAWSPPPLRLPAAAWGGGGGAGGAGEGVSFHDLRPYRPGDDLRRLHLPLYARRGELATRQQEREGRGALLLWLDATASMGAPPARWALALALCEALAEGALRGGHAVGVWREGGGQLSALAPTPTRRAVERALREARGAGAEGSGAPLLALRAAALRAPPRAALVHLSDLCGALTPEELSARARLAPPRRGPRLTLALRHPADLAPPPEGARDPETGESRALPAAGGAAFRAALEGRYAAWAAESARVLQVWAEGAPAGGLGWAGEEARRGALGAVWGALGG